ncbi:MAG: hypothetical protein JSV75_01690 [Candidatus Bathyarchaeota archaeon]|nr:MAG: hypothetical protein JSV75_01690 [Candidatus Bathyarchaeota archaeon]
MFTDSAVTLRCELVVRFEMNGINITLRHLDDDYISLIERDDAATSSVKAAETILSNEIGEKL